MRETIGRVLKSLRRSPGFVGIAAMSMGIALGISTSVFAVMDALTHPTPPFRDIEQIYQVIVGGQARTFPSPEDSREMLLKIDGIERLESFGGEWDAGSYYDELNNARMLRVSLGYFPLLDVRPRLGRLFTQADFARDDGVAIVTETAWRRRYGERTALENAVVDVRGRSYRIVGVLPPGAELSLRQDIFTPDLTSSKGGGSYLARIRPGVTHEQLSNRIRALAIRLTQVHAGPKDRGIRIYARTIKPDPLRMQDFHRAMIGAAFGILLIACANVAALMLARGIAKKRDYALRLALGAPPKEIGREVLIETAVLAVVGCLAGVLVTSWVVSLIRGAMPIEMRWEGFVEPQWSWRVLVLGMAAVVTSIAVAGGFPAWFAARTDPAGPLKEGSGNTTGRSGTRFRWLVIAEVAIAMTLLVSTSLMLKSVRLMGNFDFGYDVDRLHIGYVSAPWRRDSVSVADGSRLREQAVEAVRRVPGVEMVTATVPNSCLNRADAVMMVSDRTVEGGPFVSLLPSMRAGGCRLVNPQFFALTGLKLAEGRDFAEGDAAPGASGAVVLDERTAKRLFPHESAVGRLVKFGSLQSRAEWLPVVGVVRDHMLTFDQYPELGRDSAFTVYVARPPREDRGSRNIRLMVRAEPGAIDLPLRLRAALFALAPQDGGAHVEQWNQNHKDLLRAEQFLALVFTLMGIASLLLGAAGLYSVVSYVSSRRMREYAVRVALGATTPQISRLVLREGFVMAIGGTGLGAGFGMWAGFMLWDRMWGVYPVDAEALIIAEATLILVTMAACLVPALRASRSDPLEVMRAA